MLKGITYMVRPRMQPLNKPLQLPPHGERVFPVVRGARIVFRKRTDKRPVFHARHIVGRGAGIETARPKFLVQLGECAGLHQLVAELLILGLRAVNPMDACRLAKVCHLLDPADQVLICRWYR